MDQNSIIEFSGTVTKHKGRGKELGYPTANITVTESFPEGIFVGYSYVNTKALPSLIFIGAPLTFNEKDKKAEVYILDFSEDIYGKEIKVIVRKKLRDNKKFDSKEELIAQMEQDEREAREYFGH